MKKTVVLLIGILIFSCNQDKKEKSTAKEIVNLTGITTSNFDWLLGEWKRTNEQPSKETFASWNKLNKTEYVGSSYTTQKGDTINQEKFKLIKRDMNWDFEIKLKGETKPSVFKMTSSNSQEFICENNAANYTNKKADSPNKIKYWTENSKLYAIISGKKVNIQFVYEKLK